MTHWSDGGRAVRRLARTSLVLAVAALGWACAKGAPPPPDGGPMDRPEYVIGPADVLRVRVWKQPELSVDVPVRPDGKITVPLANDVQAAGLTTDEVRDVISKAINRMARSRDAKSQSVLLCRGDSNAVFLEKGYKLRETLIEILAPIVGIPNSKLFGRAANEAHNPFR